MEHLALTTRTVRQLIAGDYWITRSGAAVILGRSEKRVQLLTDVDRLPYVTRPQSGWRLYRRHQLLVIGNARRARFDESASYVLTD